MHETNPKMCVCGQVADADPRCPIGQTCHSSTAISGLFSTPRKALAYGLFSIATDRATSLVLVPHQSTKILPASWKCTGIK
jgi:hypothetical protein